MFILYLSIFLYSILEKYLINYYEISFGIVYVVLSSFIIDILNLFIIRVVKKSMIIMCLYFQVHW